MVCSVCQTGTDPSRRTSERRLRDRAFFVYGFAKNRIDNLNDAELREYRKLARILLNYTGAEIRRALEAGELKRVDYGNDKI